MWVKIHVQESQPAPQSFSTIRNFRCREGRREVKIIFDITRQMYQFSCNTLYYLEQPMIEIFQGMINIEELGVYIKEIPGKELDQLVLGLEFLDEHKPWRR